VASLSIATAAGHGETVGYQELLSAMVDLKALATQPHPEEFCRQFSSYDRATRWDESKKTIVGNTANGDAGHFLRTEPAGEVLADMEGPGVVYRIWSANAEGTIQIYIDGEETPRLREETQKLLGGKIEPLTEPIAGVRSRGWNLYLPIPYQKHCKILVKDPKKMYYQVTYRTLPEGTRVESFQWPLPQEWVRGIEKVKKTLSRPGSHLDDQPVQTVVDRQFTIPPGEYVGEENYGAWGIVSIEIQLDGLPADTTAQRSLLRKLLVTGTWDGEKDAVRVPLGDFFGTAPGINPYPGYPTGIRKDGTLYAYWYMPFTNYGKMGIRNLSDRTVSGRVVVKAEALSIPDDKLLYFHADWRYEPSVKRFDWPLLVSEGQGRYCGVALYVFNTQRGWWGEGDEKMWIDGENFPSTIGTGSEDYFGYAWCSPEPFFNPYHNQPLCEGPGNGNYTSVNRFQIPDNVPFHKSGRFTIEAYNQGRVTYAATTYWYGAKGASTDSTPVDLAAIKWPEPRPAAPGIKGAIEGEKLKVVTQDPKYPIGRQDISGHGEFSQDNQLWLRPRAAGATAELKLPESLKPGKYKLTLWVVRSWDYGIVQWSLNGKSVGPAVDGYSPQVVAKETDGGVVEIREGENRLSVKITGKSEKSTGFYAGLDAIRLVPVETKM
jgi:hypothetical protein